MFDTIFSWDTLWWVLMVIYVPACFSLIIIVLLQKGKGAGFAGSFGAGAGPGSETVFGPRSGQTLPVKLTYIGATVFITISIVFSMVASKVGKGTAPELLEEGGTAVEVTTELDDLGIGKGRAGAATASEAPATPSRSDADPGGDVPTLSAAPESSTSDEPQ